MIRAIDIKCDLGESFGAYTIGSDDEMMTVITSANVACGFHGGDPLIMDRTVRLAGENGVWVGAHPGFPDLGGFGRREMHLSAPEVRAALTYQVGALQAFARAHGLALQHVKAHGALYNMAASDAAAARAIAAAVAEIDSRLILVVLAGSAMERAGREAGLRIAREVFGDTAMGRWSGVPTRER